MTQNLLQVLAIITKNTGLAVVDNLSLGATSAIKDSVTEIQEYTKITNEVLYYMQIRTFLETVDLDHEEVTNFLEKNTDNQRLGIEIFKILEKTFLEKQAEFMAIAFRRYVRSEISSQNLYEYIHVIEQLNRHTLDLIEQDLEIVKKNAPQGLPRKNHELSRMGFTLQTLVKKQPLQSIGFINEEPKETPVTFAGNIQAQIIYKRTALYLNFYLDIIEDEQC